MVEVIFLIPDKSPDFIYFSLHFLATDPDFGLLSSVQIIIVTLSVILSVQFLHRVDLNNGVPL